MKNVLLGLLVTVCGFAQINVPLTVQEAIYPGSISGVARTNEPVTVGVPLPDAGGIANTSSLGLTGASVAQFSIEGTWPDGNIKWLKVRAIVPNLLAGGTATLTLTNSGSGNFGATPMATDNGSTISIVTGSASFTVKKANFNVVDSVIVGNTPVVASGTSTGLVVLGPSVPGSYPDNATCSTDGSNHAGVSSVCNNAYSSSNDASSTCAIEENGPAMAVLKCSGNFVDGSGNIYMHHTTRLYFYQGKTYVRPVVILRNADHGASNTFTSAFKGFQGLELRITPNISGTLTYTIANHTGTPTTGSLRQSSGTDYAYIYQAESTLMKQSNWCPGAPCVTPSPLSGYSIVNNGTVMQTGSGSQYPTGYADISDSTGKGVEIGQYQFAAYGDKSLEFRGGGTDVRVGLWAAENNTTSTSTLTANHPYYQAWPQWNIQEAWLNFHASTPASLANSFLSYQHYLLARAPIAQYNASGVWPYPLLDTTEENNYYAAMATSASPSVTNPQNIDMGLAVTYPTQYFLNIWRFYMWEQGGGGNQMEFHLSRLQNFARKGFTGQYLDSAHFYKMAIETAYPFGDGFDWRSYPGETDASGEPTQTSANSSLATRYWEAKYEHAHIYGIPDYYWLSGDETVRDAINESFLQHWLNTTTVVNSGRLWNARAAGNAMMWGARLHEFFASIGDSNDAATALSQGNQPYVNQIRPVMCVSGYPSGCTASTGRGNVGGPDHGVSRERGVHYAWQEQIGINSSCSAGTDADAGPFQTSIELEGLWELRRANGSGWTYHNESLDLAYGIATWALNEMYNNDGSGLWTSNGYRYYQAIDYANNCNLTSDSAGNGGQFGVNAQQTVWYPFFITHQYTGSTGWQQEMNFVLQRDSGVNATDEFFHYTIANDIYLINHPIGVILNTVPITNFTNNGGGSYTISWTVPASATSYRIKWGMKQIVDWIGFDAGKATWIGNPATTQNWFASTDAANIPTPSGTTQSLTIATGQTGLTTANFMVKAYIGTSSSSGLTAPTVSMLAPANGATVSGSSVTVSATASASVGMSSVQFKLDGANLGAAIAAGPYGVIWNTTTAAQGSHVLTAVATDTTGNSTSSAPVSVTVSNAAAGPVISSITVGSLTSSSATITWQTGIASDSQVAYGTSTAYGQTSQLASPLVLAHTVVLNGLAGSTTYHYQVMSRNQSGILTTSSDFTFTTPASSASNPSGGTSLPLNAWTQLIPQGFPAQVYGFDKSTYVNSRKVHCIWGGYHQTISSEPNEAIVCFSYAENRWSILENNGMWHTSHASPSGHTSGLWTYMPDRDTIVYATDASGSNAVENFLGHWWWFDVGGLSGEDKEFSPRPWLGATTPTSALAYDSLNSKLVLFPDATGVVEVCDPGTNACSIPATTGVAAPGTLGDLSMVFNSANHLMYVFGGGGNDVYTFNVATKAWSKLAPTCTGPDCVGGKPPARVAAGFAYSTVDNIFLMAGGLTYFGGTAYTDTWKFDPVAVAWTELSPNANYPNSANTTFDRLTYDADSNVFILVTSGGPSNYAGGTWNSYSAGVYAYAFSAASNYGRISNTYTPAAGSLNRVAPTSTTQSWAFDPAIATSGTALYAGWVETGTPFDTTNCGSHHPYIQSSLGSAAATTLPNASQATACTALDSEPSNSPADTDDSKEKLAVVNGTLWEAHEKWDLSGISSSVWSKQWNGSAWTGGQVGCFTAACSPGLVQNSQALIATGTTPTMAVVEWNHIYVPEGYLYVAQWNGSTWSPLGGGKLNFGGAGSRALGAALATDGTNPTACWSEEINSSTDRRVVTTTPQIHCASWSGSNWTPLGTSLNQVTSSWAYDPTVTYMAGKFYIGWVERTVSGNNKLYVCRWDNSGCTLLGGGALNLNTTTGWAAHASLATDGTSVYLAWEEQAALGQHSLGYVKRWSGTAWTQVGGPINADMLNGSIEGVSLAIANGLPTAIWTEKSFGNLQQVYLKQWNGSAWTAPGVVSTPVQVSCDINGDGVINATDVQLAINQALGINPCTTADLQQNGQCSVVDVQRVVNASLGAACHIGQ